MDGNIARKASHYSVYKSFRRQAVEAAARLTYMAAATSADLARAEEVCDMLARAEDYPREVW